jgi:hypothetical protein
VLTCTCSLQIMFVLFVVATILWSVIVVKAQPNAHRIHQLMIVLVTFKSLTLLSQVRDTALALLCNCLVSPSAVLQVHYWPALQLRAPTCWTHHASHRDTPCAGGHVPPDPGDRACGGLVRRLLLLHLHPRHPVLHGHRAHRHRLVVPQGGPRQQWRVCPKSPCARVRSPAPVSVQHAAPAARPEHDAPPARAQVFLADREKKILMVVIPLQVMAEVAIIVLDEDTPAARNWFTWMNILHLVRARSPAAVTQQTARTGCDAGPKGLY